MKVGRTPECIAAGLNVPERILLLCIDSKTDWQKVSRITGETVTAVVAKGLVDRDASGRLTLTDRGGFIESRLGPRCEPISPRSEPRAGPSLGASLGV